MSDKKAGSEIDRPLRTVGLTRRDFLKISGAGLAGAALLGVAGCGGGGGGQQGGGGGGGDTDTLIVGYDQEPEVLNRLTPSGTALSTTSTTAGIMQFPIRIMPDLSYEPLLAAEMPKLVSEDPQVVEYKLKDNLTWSDGKPLTSEDAKYTFDQIMNEDNDIASRVGWEDIEKFETPDEQTVRMTFSTPYAPWRDLLADNYPILPKHFYEDKDFNKALMAPPAASAFGTGGGSMGRFGGELGIKIEAPGLNARVTKQNAFGGLGLDVDSGYVAAGAL